MSPNKILINERARESEGMYRRPNFFITEENGIKLQMKSLALFPGKVGVITNICGPGLRGTSISYTLKPCVQKGYHYFPLLSFSDKAVVIGRLLTGFWLTPKSMEMGSGLLVMEFIFSNLTSSRYGLCMDKPIVSQSVGSAVTPEGW